MQSTEFNERGVFLSLAGVVEGSLVLLAFALGWVVGVSPLASFAWSTPALVWGIGGALPMFLLFWLSYRFPVGPLAAIKRFLIDRLGPSLAVCRWYDIVLLAALAGFGEELLFRGVLQPWMERWGYAAGLLGSNIVFGLAHLITPLYAILAGAIGLYLGWLLDAGGERNLLTPILTHGFYDYLAFLVVAASYRREHPASDPSADDQPPIDFQG